MKGGGSGGGGPSRSQRQRPKKTGMGLYVARLILGASVPKKQVSFFFLPQHPRATWATIYYHQGYAELHATLDRNRREPACTQRVTNGWETKTRPWLWYVKAI